VLGAITWFGAVLGAITWFGPPVSQDAALDDGAPALGTALGTAARHSVNAHHSAIASPASPAAPPASARRLAAALWRGFALW
jgi:hypothetical protein